MRKALLLVLACLVVPVGPAHAKWGAGRNDTWVSHAGRSVGQVVTGGAMPISLSPGETTTVIWSVRNLGGSPPWRHVSFHGCRWGGGFHVRYFTRDGRDVTWKATRDGYRSRLLQQGEVASLVLRITAVSSGVRSCRLSSPAPTRSDSVTLRLSG